jgi:hypothetical protein
MATAAAEAAAKKPQSIFSISCGASVFMVFYLAMAMMNLYRLMNPLSSLGDLSVYPANGLVGNLWRSPSDLFLKVYLSSKSKFGRDFFIEDHEDSVLLWETKWEGSLSKFLLLCGGCSENDTSYIYASRWLDETEKKLEGGLLSGLHAGEGIESTSFLLLLTETIGEQIQRLMALLGLVSPKEDGLSAEKLEERSIVYIPPSMFSRLHSNSTLFVHVLVTSSPLDEEEDPIIAINKAVKASALLLGKVDLVKYEIPHHIEKPKRVLFDDIKYIAGLSRQTTAPWNLEKSQPESYKTYQMAQHMKETKSGYPYWKPEVSVKYIYEATKYPREHVSMSGMQLVQVPRSTAHPTGIAILPALHVDEIGLTSEKYLPVNETITSVPLHINVDRSDVEDSHTRHTTATAGAMSPARWRLLTHLSDALESQKELGFEQSDIDDLRRLIADTNVVLLAITVLASGLHLLFEFLTFKNEVSFWRANKDITGLSVRSLFLDMIGQTIILLFLIEKDSSLLMTIPSACGCLIALWKCHRGAGFQLRKADRSDGRSVEWWNRGFRVLGYELRATRLEINKDQTEDKNDEAPNDLRRLTIETDRIATRTLGTVLLPVVVGYTLYSFLYEKHAGWYSWLITSASSAVYALGFVLMTPQLFLNYKLKSVAHLPWRVLIYKFLNTFIDDLFAFIIRMPAMARLSCFRDDIVFIIYLYQRWLYPVDASRPVEGGDGSSADAQDGITEKKKKD